MDEFLEHQEGAEETPVTMEDIRVGMSEEQKQRTLAEIMRILREGR